MTCLANVHVTNNKGIFFFPKNTALRTKPEMIFVNNMWKRVLHGASLVEVHEFTRSNYHRITETQKIFSVECQKKSKIRNPKSKMSKSQTPSQTVPTAFAFFSPVLLIF